MSVDLLDGDEVPHRIDHAAVLGAVVFDDHVPDPLQPERAQGRPLLLGPPDLRPGLGYLQLCHLPAPLSCCRTWRRARPLLRGRAAWLPGPRPRSEARAGR